MNSPTATKRIEDRARAGGPEIQVLKEDTEIVRK